MTYNGELRVGMKVKARDNSADIIHEITGKIASVSSNNNNAIICIEYYYQNGELES